MDVKKFKQAKEAYEQGDYRASARGFLDAVEPGTPISNGAAYHMAGNSLMKLKRFADAVTAYNEALRDDTYLKQGAIESNLASAHLQLGELDLALAHFEAALREPNFNNAYRCFLGVGEVMMQKDEYESAAVAYRRAAIDERNPDPGRSLVNLGIALMAMERPSDAVEAYKAALGVDGYKNKGLALSNLGLAYASLGEYKRAINAFEEAQTLHGYTLSPAATSALDKSRAETSNEESYNSTNLSTLAADLAGQPTDTFGEVSRMQESDATNAVESGADEEITSEANRAAIPVDESTEAREVGFAHDVTSHTLTSETQKFEPVQATAFVSDKGNEPEPRAPLGGVRVGTEDEVEEFFSRTDSEMRTISLDKIRKSRSPWRWLKRLAILLVILAAIAGAGYYALIQGYGYPSAQDIVKQNLEAYNSGKPFESYWTEGSNAVEQMSLVPIPASFEVGNQESDYLNASVVATLSSEGEQDVKFDFRLVRSVISWKISSVGVLSP